MQTLLDPVEELADALHGVTDQQTREQVFLKQCERFGISHFAYVNSALPTGTWHLESNYPTEWVERYVAQKYAEVDPVPIQSSRSPLAFHWRDMLERPEYGAQAQQVFHDAAQFGIHDGYTVPIHGPGGMSLMSLAVEDQSLFEPSSRHRLHALQLLSFYYHTASERSLAQAATPKVQLTPRETEVLHWAARGKTGWEIAHILHVAERTVTFHVENAKAKLGAATRSHAVVKAITLGLICP